MKQPTLVCTSSFNIVVDSGVRREKISGGVQGLGRPRRGPGGGAPRTPENFRKFAKNVLKKIVKNALF